MSQTQRNTDALPNEGPRYFDLHTTGVGYLSRVREVKVKKGGAFVCVDISALRGTSDSVEYTRFDCRVSGEEVLKVINQLRADIEAKKKVLVGFKVGDLYAETFVYEKGDKAGQTGISLKAHLLRLTFAKVDGVMVYQPPREAVTMQKAA
ncbi:MAG: STY4534 family ICE replication protein [Panacagrimonas sp.]